MQYTLPPSLKRALDPPLHSDRNLAPPLAGAQYQYVDPGEAAQVHRVCRGRVLDLAVAADPGVGPRLDPKPVRVLDQFTRPQRLSEASRFCLGIKQVRASTMCHTPPTKRMCPRGAYLCSTFQPLMTMKLASAKRVTMRGRSDTAYATWKEKQTSDGVKGIEEWDHMVNDYMDRKRRPKNPDPLGPPVSYMEDRGVFQPLTSLTNTFGLCHFYRTDPNTPMPSGPVSPAMAEHVKRLVLLASTTPRRYVLMVFRGGTVTALGLLQELHTRSALVRIPIYQSGNAKDGHGACMSCCPFCAYTIQNDPAYLNHIVCAHYDVSFGCGSCLSAITSSVQKMKDHIKECSGLTPLPMPSQESAPGGRSPKKVFLNPST